RVGRREREADSVSVSAIASKEFMAGLESIQEMKCGDRSSGTVRFVAVAGEDKRGTPVFLYDPRSSNTDHAAVPAIAFDHHAVSFAKCRVFAYFAVDVVQNAAFFILAFGVELVEVAGDLAGALDVFYAEEFHHFARDIHPPGCV